MPKYTVQLSCGVFDERNMSALGDVPVSKRPPIRIEVEATTPQFAVQRVGVALSAMLGPEERLAEKPKPCDWCGGRRKVPGWPWCSEGCAHHANKNKPPGSLDDPPPAKQQTPSALSARVQELEGLLNDLSQQRDKANLRKYELANELDRLRADVEHARRSAADAETQLRGMTAHRDTLQAGCTKLEEKLAHVLMDNKELSDEVDNLKSRVENYSIQFTALHAELEATKKGKPIWSDGAVEALTLLTRATPEYQAVLQNLTNTQTRCTELLEETRRLKKGLFNIYDPLKMELDWSGEKWVVTRVAITNDDPHCIADEAVYSLVLKRRP